jgi:hypothetical protein
MAEALGILAWLGCCIGLAHVPIGMRLMRARMTSKRRSEAD